MTSPSARWEALVPAAALRADDSWWPRPAPRPFRHVVGARTLAPGEWLRPRPHDGPLIAWRRALLDEQGAAAFDALPGTETAGQVVLDLLRAEHGLEAAPGGHPLGHPLDRAGRTVAEDLCLVDISPASGPHLVGASLAMPNRWLLAEKLGRPMLDIHGPVPGYAHQLSGTVDRFLKGLRGHRIMTRANWAITDDSRLFQPAADSRARPGARNGTAADALYVRVEYQTLRLLPEPARDSVLFTIRTAHEPLSALADRPPVAGDLASTIEVMPDADLDYKGVLPYRDAVLDLLRAYARGDTEEEKP
ncbi:heme-dependent oxidative N-demethylase subunit alpha family protein [Kineosporia succinea]|uniref:DUF3445 domain-containing protein n=1 Tax=Kineosporia succinea TaxID=84632 RepID=A0ABT9PB57_9ACTN|nr:heme-dependent oxidative N-demethylase subunit alpha family protein [Kineosporia succinea]MDP9829265.1 hypothetical protein [Kineosporia succinea]